MKIKILAIITAIAFSFSSFTSLSAADIPDEQLTIPRPPVENTGGYSGAYFDDQRTLFRAFTYVEAWSSNNFALADVTTCKAVTDEPCNSSDNVFFETPMSPCSMLILRDCIISLSGKVGEGALISATLVETVKTTIFKEFRGKGLGASLSQAIEDECQRKGVKKIISTVYYFNHVMVQIKLKQGYTIEGYHPDHEAPGFHEYSLGKVLK